jgi:cis-L-3-hydroxyproline dehydratase
MNDMKISRISVYEVTYSHDGPKMHYTLTRGSQPEQITTVVIETNQGVVGCGESPTKPYYIPGFAAGARAGIAELAPHLIGEDPTQLGKINHIMDSELRGHAYVKSAIDIACWDILGKVAGLPLYVLLGGLQSEELTKLYVIINIDTPEKMVTDICKRHEEGFRIYQPKLGETFDKDIERIRATACCWKPGEFILVDANRGGLTHDAIRIVKALRDFNNIYIEQPCGSIEELKCVRNCCSHPIVLDELMDSPMSLLRAYHEGVVDGVAIKLSNVGGLTKARQMRDLCMALGLPMKVEDIYGGSGIIVAATAHLAHTIPQNLTLGYAYDFYDWPIDVVEGIPEWNKAKCSVRASARPGLGVRLRTEALGRPAGVYG